MSQWTHVCGCIRIDCLIHDNMKERVQKALGKTLMWESPAEMWDEVDNHPDRFTPTGSEGGVEYDIWENPNDCHMAAYTVSIWGDLRDYSSVDEITNWFNKVLYDSNLIIRDAVLSIDVEYRSKVILAYDDESNKCRALKIEEETK